ncbi:MAG: OPT/YSL family transporter [Candidatus Obscuribacterales bacterium]|nr:OPT/YSL family transporter [Candidatus Obscuribacterales bacterium]
MGKDLNQSNDGNTDDQSLPTSREVELSSILKDEAISEFTGSLDEAREVSAEIQEAQIIEQESSSIKSYEERELHWYKNVYQGDNVPQLTVRALVMGGVLGMLMSISNLYTHIKLGWGFGVAITACVLSFVIWRTFMILIPRLSKMSILESNCMQSTASAAGYSTGSTVGMAFGAYLLIEGHHLPWHLCAIWTFATAMLGVMLAVPMKRQMINKEQLPFPSGIAAAETLKSLYGGSKEAVYQAYSLVVSLVLGALTGIASKGEWAWQKTVGFKLPELVPFNLTFQGFKMESLRGFGFEPSLLLLAAGMIVGMRVSLSMFISAVILYFAFGPWLVTNHIIESGGKIVSAWALWAGTAIMVSSGLTAFALQWKTIVRTFANVNTGNDTSEHASELAAMNNLEVPLKWCVLGAIPFAILLAVVMFLSFKISLPLGLFAVLLSFLLALVACRATGETDITPTGAMGKVSQLTYAVLCPGNITANLMTASVTANTAIASADLLTDLKSGYILGANPRKQFFAQLTGVFFGVLAVVPAWYLMIPTKEVLESYNPPATTIWKAVAEALSRGIDSVPQSAQIGIMIGLALGFLLTLIDHFFPKLKKFTPSAMGLGLAWVMPFQNALAFLLGASAALIWKKVHEKSAEIYTIPVASGAIAGESLASAFIAILSALAALGLLK